MAIKNCLEKEIENLTTLAEQGHAKAQFEFGYILYEKDQNSKIALEWFQKSAEQGYAVAQYL